MPSRVPVRSAVSGALVALLVGAPTFGTVIQKQNIAVTGQAAPIAGADATWTDFFASFDYPMMNSAGHVAFAAAVQGSSVVPGQEIVLVAGPPNSLRLVWRSGLHPAGTPTGVVAYYVGLPSLSSTGRVFFAGLLTGGGTTTATDYGWFLESSPPGGDPIPVLLEGRQAPAMAAGVIVASIDENGTAFGPNAEVSIGATLSGPGITAANSYVLYKSTSANPGSLQVFIRQGDAVLGMAGATYVYANAPYFGPDGSVVCRIGFAGAGITTANDEAIAYYPPGSTTPTILAREGNSAAGSGVYGQFFLAGVNAHGDVGCTYTITGLPTAVSAVAVGPRDGSGPLREIARTNMSLPGFPAGTQMSSIAINRYDASAERLGIFVARVVGVSVPNSADSGIFSEAPGGVGVIGILAKEGDLPPGLPAGYKYADFGISSNVNVAINQRRQAAFFAYAPSTTNTDISYSGLWVADSMGVVQLVAHRAVPYQLATGDVRTVSTVGYRLFEGSGPQTGGRQWFDDSGRLLFSMSFADTGSGPTAAMVLVTVDPPCRGDFNHSGAVSVQDLFDFLAAWFAHLPSADINGSGMVSVQDLFDFLAAWFAGC